MLYSWGPDKIEANDGKVSGLALVRCTSVFDDQGNFCPYFDEAKTTVAADQVILAIGQASETAFCQDFCFLDDQLSLPVEKGLIAINNDTQETEMKGVFAGGDAANGPATVIEAIAAGRRAAISIDKHLGGNGVIEVGSRNAEVGSEDPEVGMRPPAHRGLRPGGNAEVGINECGNGYDGKRESGFAELKKVEVPTLPISERIDGFTEVELCFSDEQAKEEAHRCLQCDLEICLAMEKRE
jgi:NADPH-dependent glutamate synthase beta subunit-like oxidoreductase